MYLGIDIGTSSVKAVLLDSEQQVLGSASAALQVQRPHEGWSEQHPNDWIKATANCLTNLAQQHPNAIAAVAGIGLSGQMHGATLLDSADQVLRPCILWNDSRSASEAADLDTDRSRELIGNITFPGFTSPKLLWVRTHEPDNFKKICKVLLPKDYLRLWLTGEHVAEMSDASGTGWLNIAERKWATELLEQTHLDIDAMPRLVEGTEVSGRIRDSIANQFGLPKGVVVAGGAGDNAASACGVGIISPGNAFLSLGTSGVVFAANSQFQPNVGSAVHAFCHALPNTWHQMGVILAATDSLNWWAKVNNKRPADLSGMLDAAHTYPEIIFLPYLGGERTPHNDPYARSCFLGMGHSSDLPAMTHAVLQGVAFAFRDSVAALLAANTRLDSAMVIGGGSASPYWLQLLADTIQIPMEVTSDADLGASLGAARLGLIAAESADPAEVCTPPAVEKVYAPNSANADKLDTMYQRYKAAYSVLKPILQKSKAFSGIA